VPSSNLSRDEARERARMLTVDSYDVSLDLTVGDKVFRSETVIRFGCNEDGAAVRLDLTAETVREIVLNGRDLDPFEVHREDGLHLKDLQPRNELRVVADLPYMRTGEGMHRFVDPADGAVYLYTQHETNDAHRTYACFDQPDLKATFALTVTAPDTWHVLSNEAPGQPEPLREGVARWTFPATPPISTYITVIAAGPYHQVLDEYVRADGSTVPLGLYCRASLGAFLDPPEILEITKQGLAFFEREFGRPYPFGKYDQVGVAEFNAGAMENAGCVTFHEDYFVFRSKVTDALRDARANTILHEMAHMWFGDLVTMRWWDDLWLNESFAEFMAYHSATEATRFRDAWTGFATGRKAWGYRQDQLPSTHPIVADAPDIETVKANFDGITYAKGASVLRQLVAWVGLPQFMAGLRAYFDKHAWGNTTLSDLLVELERESGRDLAAWSREWLETAGCNTLRPAFELAEDGTFATFTVAQEAPADHPTLRAHRLGIGLYDLADGRLSLRERHEIDVVGASTEVPELAGVRQPDLLLLNDGDLTFAKIRLDERSLTTLVDHLSVLDSSLARALCWAATWDMCRDAEMPAKAFVELVANGVGAETDIVTLQSDLRVAQSALDLYVPLDQRAPARAGLAEALRAYVLAAEPGSDQQLAFVRAFAVAATSAEDHAYLAQLLDGSTVLPGLAVDAELRWHLLRRLVVHGRAGDAEIEAEIERDATAGGQRHAATVRAARPTLEAKSEAWSQVVEHDELPNALQTATIVGFMEPDQRELLRPFVERYFDSLRQVWETRTSEMASNIVMGLYPALFVEQAVVDRTNAYLDSENPPAVLARMLAEGRSGVERALRAQQLYG
jgi:aminopeptidase N